MKKINMKLFKGHSNSLQTFINLWEMAEQNGHTILGTYINTTTKILIDFKCEHSPQEVTPNKYKSNSECPECLKNERLKTKRKYNKNTERAIIKHKKELEETVSVLTVRFNNKESLLKNDIGKELSWKYVRPIEKEYGTWANGIENIFNIKDYTAYSENIRHNRQKRTVLEKTTLEEAKNVLINNYVKHGTVAKSLMKQKHIKKLESEYGDYGNAVKNIIGIDYKVWVHERVKMALQKSANNRTKKKKPKVSKKVMNSLALQKESEEIVITRFNSGASVAKGNMKIRNINSLTRAYGDYGTAIELICNIQSYDEYIKELIQKSIKATTKWNEESCKKWLLDRIENNEPVNHLAVQNMHVFSKIIEIFGTYKALWDACGLDYEQYKLEHQISIADSCRSLSERLSIVGHKFEALTDEIFNQLNYDYTKYSMENSNIQPDYIFNNGIIGDCKLTKGTKNVTATIQKYISNCQRLEFYFLNSNKAVEVKEVMGKDVVMYNIDYIINNVKGESQLYFRNKVSELRNEVDSIYKQYQTA